VIDTILDVVRHIPLERFCSEEYSGERAVSGLELNDDRIRLDLSRFSLFGVVGAGCVGKRHLNGNIDAASDT